MSREKKRWKYATGVKEFEKNEIVEKNMGIVCGRGVEGDENSGNGSANPSQIRAASEVGYVLIKFPQKTFALFCELLGESQRHF